MGCREVRKQTRRGFVVQLPHHDTAEEDDVEESAKDDEGSVEEDEDWVDPHEGRPQPWTAQVAVVPLGDDCDDQVDPVHLGHRLRR